MSSPGCRRHLNSNDDIPEGSFADVAERAFADNRAQVKSGKREVFRNGGRGRVDVEAESGVRLEAREVFAVKLRSLDLVCAG